MKTFIPRPYKSLDLSSFAHIDPTPRNNWESRRSKKICFASKLAKMQESATPRFTPPAVKILVCKVRKSKTGFIMPTGFRHETFQEACSDAKSRGYGIVKMGVILKKLA